MEDPKIENQGVWMYWKISGGWEHREIASTTLELLGSSVSYMCMDLGLHGQTDHWLDPELTVGGSRKSQLHIALQTLCEWR